MVANASSSIGSSSRTPVTAAPTAGDNGVICGLAAHRRPALVRRGRRVAPRRQPLLERRSVGVQVLPGGEHRRARTDAAHDAQAAVRRRRHAVRRGDRAHRQPVLLGHQAADRRSTSPDRVERVGSQPGRDQHQGADALVGDGRGHGGVGGVLLGEHDQSRRVDSGLAGDQVEGGADVVAHVGQLAGREGVERTRRAARATAADVGGGDGEPAPGQQADELDTEGVALVGRGRHEQRSGTRPGARRVGVGHVDAHAPAVGAAHLARSPVGHRRRHAITSVVAPNPAAVHDAIASSSVGSMAKSW